MMIREKEPTDLDNGDQPEGVDVPAPASDKNQSMEPNVKILRLTAIDRLKEAMAHILEL